MDQGKWTLTGVDGFSDEPYEIPGAYDTEERARDVARLHLAAIELTQPTSETGGQGEDGIQDRIYIISPNGNEYRYFDDSPTRVPPKERVV